MNLGWFICINMIIGIPMYFITCVVFTIIECIKYGEEIMDEVLENLKEKSDNIYLSLVKDPRIMYVLSFILVFALWEFMLPMLYYSIHQDAKELYRTKNGA